MSAHTKGPWRFDGRWIRAASTWPDPEADWYIAEMCDHVEAEGGGDAMVVNASLIAAAPDLFAEVEREYTDLANPRNEWDGRNTPEGQRKLCRLRDLIAKVAGRDPQDVQDDYGNRHLARPARKRRARSAK